MPLAGASDMALQLLRRVDLFLGLPCEGHASLAAQANERAFGAGAVLIEQGAVHPWMYVIVSGRVLVERAHRDLTGPLLLAECGPGDVVGEADVLDLESRREGARAVEATATLELSAAAVAGALLEHPAAAAEILPLLSRRLRTVEDLARQQWLPADDKETRR
jgi:CRP/FNR family cyclic AMP-dependent transcriptional regulator